MAYPDQHPIAEEQIDALRVNSRGQHFQFEEAFFTDPITGQEMHYIEAYMIGHPAKLSKFIPLAKSSIGVVELVCTDLRRMLELSEESARMGGMVPLGDIPNA